MLSAVPSGAVYTGLPRDVTIGASCRNFEARTYGGNRNAARDARPSGGVTRKWGASPSPQKLRARVERRGPHATLTKPPRMPNAMVHFGMFTVPRAIFLQLRRNS